MDTSGLRCLVSLLIVSFYACHGQVVFQATPQDVGVAEGGDAVFRCEATEGGSPTSIGWLLRSAAMEVQTALTSGTVVSGIGSVMVSTGNRNDLTLSSVSSSIDGSTVTCISVGNILLQTAQAVITIYSTPSYSTLPDQSTTPLEGSSFSHSFSLSGDTSPSFNWTKDGVDHSTDGRISTTASSIVIADVQRTDSGTYHVFGSNIAGTATASFVLDVIFPPEFSGLDNSRTDVLSRGSSFTFNCTPSAANPAPSFSFMRDGITYTEPAGNINGPVLAISSVVRADTGNYSCTATNTAGSTTLYHNLLVVARPTSPRGLTRIGLEAFSVRFTWTPPTDDGGISHPSWTPPSSSSSFIIQYTVTYSNSSGSWSIDNLNTPQVTLSILQHSTDYTVTVAASNAHGLSTGVQGTFRTLDNKPILKAVVLAPLSLNNFTANLTFLTVGGQNVTSFSIRVNGTIVEGFTSESVAGDGIMVSLLIEGRSFTKGTYYTVEITATNSVGTSEPITGLLYLPNSPMITGTFTEVSAGSIPSTKCCTGVQLRLAEQPDVSDLKVLLTPQGGNQFTVMVNPADLSLNGSVLYIGGVQAGTDYTAVVTISNIFGSSPEQQLQLKPLFGVPSNPNPPTVSVNGGQVTVELSTAYPGTVQTGSGSIFRFEIQFIEDGQRSSRQSKTVTHSVTPPAQSQDLSTAVRASYVDKLNPGSYSVSVTAVNEHGRSSAVMSDLTFTVQAPCSCPAPNSVDTVTIVLIVIIVVQFLLLVAMVIGGIVVVSHKLKREGPMKSVDSMASQVKKSPTEPVYAETEMGRGNHGDIALQSNVAYGTIEAGTKPPPPQPTQSATGGAGSEYEVVDTKNEERKKTVEGGQYSNFTVL